MVLLAKAVGAVNDRATFDRYLELMQRWPFAMFAPIVMLKTSLPDSFFQADQQAPGQGNDQQDSEPPPADDTPLTPDQYRKALKLAMERLSLVTMDRDLQDLIMKQLETLGRQDPSALA